MGIYLSGFAITKIQLIPVLISIKKKFSVKWSIAISNLIIIIIIIN